MIIFHPHRNLTIIKSHGCCWKYFAHKDWSIVMDIPFKFLSVWCMYTWKATIIWSIENIHININIHRRAVPCSMQNADWFDMNKQSKTHHTHISLLFLYIYIYIIIVIIIAHSIYFYWILSVGTICMLYKHVYK